MVLVSGWLFAAVSGFCVGVAVCGCVWFWCRGGCLRLFLVLVPGWLFVAVSGFGVGVAVCGCCWFLVSGWLLAAVSGFGVGGGCL